MATFWPSRALRKRPPTPPPRGSCRKRAFSGKGLLDFFGKLQNQEYRLAIYSTDSFDRDPPPVNRAHPGAGAEASAPIPPGASQATRRSKRVSNGSRPSCIGFVDPKQAVKKYPESDQSVPAHYARAYAYHLGGYPDKAEAEANALLAEDPHDPFFLELKGQILLEGGKPQEAIAPLREATERSGNTPLIAAMLGHALVATEDSKISPRPSRC